METGQIN